MSNPLHSDYCNCECPEGVSFSKLQETLNRVRMVHVYDVVDDMAFCKACPNPETERYKWQEWPCETMKALDGDDL
jgi:hypothetical protein